MAELKYRVGDTVTIKDHEIGNCGTGCYYFVSDMAKYIGETVTVTRLRFRSYDLDIDKCWSWSDCMLVSATKDMIYKTELTDMQRASLDADMQTLVEAGAVSSTLDISNTTMFLNWLLTENKAEYAAFLRAKLAEQDKKKESDE